MISKVNIAQRSLTVEWYEKGETKGKEVELDAILQLNPEILGGKNEQSPEFGETISAAPQPKKQATSAANLSRVNIYVCLFVCKMSVYNDIKYFYTARLILLLY